MALSLVTAAVLTACGGGGNGGSDTAAPSSPARSEPSVQLSGTAATGAALVNASVAVKCANASGTATTDASGKYSLNLTGGALPCVIQVSGEQGGVAVTLHSLAEAGSTDAASGTTSASANVTPLTEMIVAQLSAGLPSDLFAAFGSGTAVSTEQLVAATNAVLGALKEATGIDLGSIDPFKATLVAATSGAPDGGNEYDKLLDSLGAKVSIEALPQVVNQIASAAGSGSAGGEGAPSLGDVLVSAAKGPLAGCPVAASGKYRTLDHYGRTSVRDIDFSAGTFTAGDGSVFTISADAAKPCEFSAQGTQGGNAVRFDFAMGTAGLALYRAATTIVDTSVTPNTTQTRASVGYLFPVQSHAKAAAAGSWSMLQSGFVPGEGFNGFVHWMAGLTVGADDQVELCDIDYRNAPGTCVPDAEAGLSLAARTDGGFDLNVDGQAAASVYGYRSPSGALNLFGTTNPSGANTPTTEQSHFILTRHQAQAVPAVGTVSKYFDLQLNRQNGTNVVTGPTADATTIATVNGSTVTRVRASDSRSDTIHFNEPLPGVRHRDAGTNPDGSAFAEVYQFTVPGSGVTVSLNAEPTSATRSYFYAPSVQRN